MKEYIYIKGKHKGKKTYLDNNAAHCLLQLDIIKEYKAPLKTKEYKGKTKTK